MKTTNRLLTYFLAAVLSQIIAPVLRAESGPLETAVEAFMEAEAPKRTLRFDVKVHVFGQPEGTYKVNLMYGGKTIPLTWAESARVYFTEVEYVPGEDAFMIVAEQRNGELVNTTGVIAIEPAKDRYEFYLSKPIPLPPTRNPETDFIELER